MNSYLIGNLQQQGGDVPATQAPARRSLRGVSAADDFAGGQGPNQR